MYICLKWHDGEPRAMVGGQTESIGEANHEAKRAINSGCSVVQILEILPESVRKIAIHYPDRIIIFSEQKGGEAEANYPFHRQP